MKQKDRYLAFFGAMLIAFGVSTMDLENFSIEASIKELIAIGAGLIFLVILYVNRYRDRKS